MTARALLVVVVAAVGLAAPVAAQDRGALGAAIQSGQVGERYDGYMGFASSPSAEVRRQVSAINLKRRSLYLGLATQRHVNAQVVGIATGCELIAGLRAGQSYMLGDGVWHRLTPGQTPPMPDYCR